jgi:hypothetical protein
MVVPDRPRAGDTIGLASADRALDFIPIGTVVRAKRDAETTAVHVEMDRPLPSWAAADTTFVNLSASPRVHLSNVIVRRNRARGFLLQVPDVLVEHCRFENQSGAAILLTADRGRWWEGPYARRVSIKACQFIGGNDGAGREAGLVASKGSDVKGRPVGYSIHADLSLRGCRFQAYQGSALDLASVSGVIIDRCLFDGTISAAFPPPALQWTKNHRRVVTITHLRSGSPFKRYRHLPIHAWPSSDKSVP